MLEVVDRRRDRGDGSMVEHAGRTSTRGGTLQTLGALLLAVLGLSLAWRAGDRAVGLDFYQFWAVGLALGDPVTPSVYSDEGRRHLGAVGLERARRDGHPRHVAVAEGRTTLETYSSPWLYTLFRWAATGRYETDFRNYRVLVLVALAGGVLLLCRLLDHSRAIALGAVGIVAGWFEPFLSDLRVGGVNSLQLALLAAYLWVVTRMRWRLRDVLGGALLGLGLAFKPNLGFVAAPLVADWARGRQGRRLALHGLGAAGGALAAMASAAASFGSWRCWTAWLSAVGALPDEIVTVELGNVAPSRVLAEGLGVHVGLPLGIVLTGLALATSWWASPREAARGGSPGAAGPALRVGGRLGEAGAVALGALLTVLVPPLSWYHYHVLSIPAFLVALCPAAVPAWRPRLRPWHRAVLGLAFVAVTLQPMLSLGVRLSAVGEGAIVVLGAGTLFALMVLARGARPASPPDRTIAASAG